MKIYSFLYIYNGIQRLKTMYCGALMSEDLHAVCFSGRATEEPWSLVEREYWKPSGRGQKSLLALEKLFHPAQMLPTDVTSSWLTHMRKNMEVFERLRSSLHQVNKTLG